MPKSAACTGTSVLRTEFRKIVMTLTIVTAINNSGHSTLLPLHGDGPSSLRIMLSRERRSQTTVMNSIASLLAHEEAVAVTSICTLPQNSDRLEFLVVAHNEGKDLRGEEGSSGREDQSTRWVGEQGGHGYVNSGSEEGEEEGAMKNGDEVIAERYPRSQPINKCSSPGSFTTITNASQNCYNFENLDNLLMIMETSQSHWPAISQLDPMDILNPDKLGLK